MKWCISEVHLGRYKFEILDENNQVTAGFDGGSAMIMVMLNRLIFERENAAYQRDQKLNSDQLGEDAIKKMKADPQKYLPEGVKLIDAPKVLKDG